jgi:hypothetical protein
MVAEELNANCFAQAALLEVAGLWGASSTEIGLERAEQRAHTHVAHLIA